MDTYLQVSKNNDGYGKLEQLTIMIKYILNCVIACGI